MTYRATQHQFTRKLDPVVMKWLRGLRRGCLALAILVALVILFAWWVPAVGALLPTHWVQMQATTAVSILLLTVALALRKPGIRGWRRAIVFACALLVLALVGMSLYEYAHDQMPLLGLALVADEHLAFVHPTSLQSGACFFLIAAGLFIDPARQDKPSYVLDVTSLLLVMLDLLYLAGYINQTTRLIGVNTAILISPQTLFCIGLLTFAKISRRIPYGSYAILVSSGASGTVARVTLPIAVSVTYVIVLGQMLLLNLSLLAISFIPSLSAMLAATVVIVVVIVLTHKIDKLEMRLRDLSITDELTGACNLRGLKLHGRQMLLESGRVQAPLMVAFIDVDGLKQVNDTLGHDIGSNLIRDVAGLLRESFRESDIIARVGGDEFVVMAFCSPGSLSMVLERLDGNVKKRNASGANPYTISFSTGTAIHDAGNDEPFEALLERADAAMYAVKMQRRSRHAESPTGAVRAASQRPRARRHRRPA